MARQRIPEEVLSAAHARSRARAAMDWAEADRLRSEIEAAGWRVVDRGIDFALSPAHPPDLEGSGTVRYGASRNVPSRLEDPPAGLATVVLTAAGRLDVPEAEAAANLRRSVDDVLHHSHGSVSIVVAADAPGPDLDAMLDSIASEGDRRIEVIRTSAALGVAAALNAGARRAAGPVAILLDPGVVPSGDFVRPLVHALEDPTVAVAGPWGLVSADLRRWEAAPAGQVDAVELACLAFRRGDYVDRGPLEEKFQVDRYLDVWWSLVLRDEGEGHPPRRALALEGLPIGRREGGREAGPAEEGSRDRAERRNFYRLLDRFGSRRDLIGLSEIPSTAQS